MPRVVVIGLGIFGYNVVKDLFEAGMDVIAVIDSGLFTSVQDLGRYG